MCFALPVKIRAIRDRKIIAEENGRKKEVAGSLIKVKRGDYVILQNNFIVSKVSRKAAKEILNLINNKS
jgi:hydrogenase maturation factor